MQLWNIFWNIFLALNIDDSIKSLTKGSLQGSLKINKENSSEEFHFICSFGYFLVF